MLCDRLKDLEKEKRYPFHMPGHKRNPGAEPLAQTMAIDITEIDGFDDLHNASGIIKEAQERAAALYGSEECRYLVNGSTAGVLAAVSAVLCGRDKPFILAGKGSHISLYHAAYLNDAAIDTLWERRISSRGVNIPGVADPGDVKEHLEQASAGGLLPAAVFVTDPNYYGVVADTCEIVRIAHGYGVPVIVDAAHGAHFGFKDMPGSAVQAGADLVIMSVHKTLPCLTQTALLHMQGELIRKDIAYRFLRIYQTSSPSYVLMSSIESGLKTMADGDGWSGRLLTFRQRIREGAKDLEHLTILPDDIAGDPCKLVISTIESSISGYELHRRLLEEYALQAEMADTDNVVLIITGMDTEEGISRLAKALKEIDGSIGAGMASCMANASEMPRPSALMTIREAWDAPSEPVPLSEAAGRVCADMIVPYPPGTPALVPGEQIDRESVAFLETLIAEGCEIRGIDENGFVHVIM
ncbi:MAG: decarboxylase [Lachnospiraceae bacterium]|nr:decarboxylase [Lachnospiraceae bacterium]